MLSYRSGHSADHTWDSSSIAKSDNDTLAATLNQLMNRYDRDNNVSVRQLRHRLLVANIPVTGDDDVPFVEDFRKARLCDAESVAALEQTVQTLGVLAERNRFVRAVAGDVAAEERRLFAEKSRPDPEALTLTGHKVICGERRSCLNDVSIERSKHDEWKLLTGSVVAFFVFLFGIFLFCHER